MPPVVGAVAVFVGSLVAGASLTVAAALAFISLAAGMASMMLTPKPQLDLGGLGDPGRMITHFDPARPRELVYGTVRKAGVVVYLATTSDTVEPEPGVTLTLSRLHLVVVLAGHEVAGIDEVYFDDTLAVNAAGQVQAPYDYPSAPGGPVVVVAKHLGAADQTADAALMAALPEWTADHRLRGIAYLYVRLTHTTEPVLFRGLPNITAVVRGKKVFDPRTALTGWSDNAALCLADYLADATYGLGAAYGTEIDEAALVAAANVCDELVAIPDGQGGTTTEPRYTANGVLSSAEEPKRHVEALLSAMAGRCVYSGGTWLVQAGAFETPTLTLDEDDLRGHLQVRPRLARRDLCNAVRGLFLGDPTQWQPGDFPPVVSDTFRDQDGGERIWRDVELRFTTSETAAQRLAKIELFAAREQVSAVVACGLRALAVRAGDTVALTNARLGWAAKPFLVTDWQFTVQPDDHGAPALGVTLELRETSAAVYDTTADEQTLMAAAPDSTLASPFVVAPPTGLTLESGDAQLYLRGDGTVMSRLRASWVAPVDGFVRQGGRLEVQAKRSADPDWLPHALLPGDATETFIFDVEEGVEYDVRVRALNAIGAASAWATATNHRVLGKRAVPAAPSAISVRQRAAGAVEVFVAFSPPLDWGTTELWRNTVNQAGSATKLDSGKRQTFTDQQAPVGQQVYYFARVVDTSGNASGFSPATTNGILVTLIDTDDVTPDAITGGASAKADSALSIGATWTTLVEVTLAVPPEGGEYFVWAGAEVVGGDAVEFQLLRDATPLTRGSAHHAGAYTISLQDIDTVGSQAFDPAAFHAVAFHAEALDTAPTYTLQARNIGGGTPTAAYRRVLVLDRKR